jgi:hypothetical protein
MTNPWNKGPPARKAQYLLWSEECPFPAEMRAEVRRHLNPWDRGQLRRACRQTHADDPTPLLGHPHWIARPVRSTDWMVEHVATVYRLVASQSRFFEEWNPPTQKGTAAKVGCCVRVTFSWERPESMSVSVAFIIPIGNNALTAIEINAKRSPWKGEFNSIGSFLRDAPERVRALVLRPTSPYPTRSSPLSASIW